MLTMKLILDRLDREGRLLERREQPSRSFTKGFLQLLYVAHLQPTYAVPYSMPDITGAPRDVDSDGGGSWHLSKPTLAIASPPGLTGINYCSYSANAGRWNCIVQGEKVGIQVGVGTDAVAPDDYALTSRIAHGVRPPDGANVSFESYKVNDNLDYEIYADKWCCQTFRPKVGHKLYSVKLKLYREGSPGTVTVAIYPVTEYKPAGSALVTGTTNGDTLTDISPGEWREITFPSQIDLVPGMDYAIVVHITGGSTTQNIHWRYGSADSEYPRGQRGYSANGGSSWTTSPGQAHMFEEFGRSIGEFQYGGCELIGLAFSDPNGEFTIRRYFNNACGVSKTVNECGIHAIGSQHGTSTGDGFAWPFCIAHDIVSPGVAVADAELLRATYVPQITV